jgi:hypothetical protein
MRETELIENYLNGQLKPEDKLLTEARLLVNPDLKDKKYWQQITYRLIKNYSRKQIRNEITQAQNRLFSEKEFAGFRQKIKSIFN